MSNKRSKLGMSAPVFIATTINVLFSIFVAFLAFQAVPTEVGDIPRWELFLTAKPNEIGDTLAGIFGSMTLIWVVASVFQQSLELRAQREEFALMADAQSAQVDALRAQTVIFEDEKRARSATQVFAQFNNLIRDFFYTLEMRKTPRFQLQTLSSSGTKSDFSFFDGEITTNWTTDQYRINDKTLKSLIKDFLSSFAGMKRANQARDFSITSNMDKTDRFGLLSIIQAMVDLREKMSLASAGRFDRMGILEFHLQFSELLDLIDRNEKGAD